MTKSADKPAKPHKKRQIIKHTLFGFLSILIGLLIGVLAIYFYLFDKIYPAISIANVDISSQTPTQSEAKITQNIQTRLNQPLEFTYQSATNSSQPQKFQITLSENMLQYNINDSLNEALNYGHHKFYFTPVNIPIKITFNDSFNTQIKTISQSIDQTPIDSSLKVDDDQIIVSESHPGRTLNQEDLKQILTEYINTGKITRTDLPVKDLPPKLSYDSALEIKKRLDQIKLSPLKLTFQDRVFNLDLPHILAMIDIQNSQSSLAQAQFFGNKINLTSANIAGQDLTENQLTLNEPKVKQYLDQISGQINRDVQEPLFSVAPGSDPQKPKINEFKPPLEGQTLLQDQAYDRLSQALLTPNQTTVQLPVQIVKPKNQLVNDLGIKELIGQGNSDFAGSIPNRVYNVGLAASRINGVLISPGETFSFDQTIGDVTAATGYKQAYVIKSGRTVLDDGGGVCQISTTLFRAVLNAGLPVLERTAHAYRVHYYENGGYPPGIDATIFYPSVDFKFKNDTDHSILIQTYINGTQLAVNLYGTSDGRVATVSKPLILNQTPPPPDLRQDDPTLPKGQVKQVDFSAWGANITFNRTVIRGGQTLINETFHSNFRPWQAIYLVGTKEG